MIVQYPNRQAVRTPAPARKSPEDRPAALTALWKWLRVLDVGSSEES